LFEENLMGQLVTDWRDRSLALLWLFLVARLKIWDLNPTAGSIKARKAYVGGPFKINKEYTGRQISK